MSSLLLEHLFFTPLKVRGGIKLSLTDPSLLWSPLTQEGLEHHMETRKIGPRERWPTWVEVSRICQSGDMSQTDSLNPTSLKYHRFHVFSFTSKL